MGLVEKLQKLKILLLLSIREIFGERNLPGNFMRVKSGKVD